MMSDGKIDDMTHLSGRVLKSHQDTYIFLSDLIPPNPSGNVCRFALKCKYNSSSSVSEQMLRGQKFHSIIIYSSPT